MGSQPALSHKDVSNKRKETKQNENHIRKDNFIASFLVSHKKRGKVPNVVRNSAPAKVRMCIIPTLVGRKKGGNPEQLAWRQKEGCLSQVAGALQQTVPPGGNLKDLMGMEKLS